MNIQQINNQIAQIEMSERRTAALAPFFTWLVQLALNNPELLLKVVQVLVKVAKWALSNFRDKDGMPRTPFWLKALGWVGVKPMQELRQVCDEACEAVEKLPMIPPKG